MQSRKTVILFTSEFPFGKGEQFIETEIIFLSQRFKEVHIIPLNTAGPQRAIPENARIIKSPLYQPYSRVGMLLRNGLSLLSWYKHQLKITRHPEKYSGKFRHYFNYLMHRHADAANLSGILSSYKGQDVILYSYWFNVWATVLLFAKKAGELNMPVITRAHGGDLDERQRKSGFFPFRSTEMELIDKVICVSDFGRNLLISEYPKAANRIFTQHLGVSDHGINPEPTENIFRIVTCSFVYGLKRLHLVVDILSKLKFRIDWVHFGEGELLDQLKNQAAQLPSNITCSFPGLVPNETVLKFYRDNHVDLFMNVSELEGIPVSIMEAISFGIPVTGCRICGVPEIVNSQTGFLLDKDFDVTEVARLIEEYHGKTDQHKHQFRQGVRDFWFSNFNAGVNYSKFIDQYLI
jgi:glycosyltransferase involved in cell wall biosynthesis